VPQLLARSHMEVLLVGNITADEARSLAQQLRGKLGRGCSLEAAARPRDRCVCVGGGGGVLPRVQWARGELWSPAAMPLAVCVRAACVGLLGWRCIGSTHHSWAETLCIGSTHHSWAETLCMRAAGCRCVRLPESSSTLHCQPTKNPEEDNGVVEAYYQVGGSCRAAAGHLLGCAGQLMPHPAPFSKRGRTPSPLPVMPPVVPWTPPAAPQSGPS